jgi:hypothetical protein
MKAWVKIAWVIVAIGWVICGLLWIERLFP